MIWHDATLPLSEATPPYPGDPGLVVRPLLRYERGDACWLSAISMSAHLGTHVDAPLHFVPNGASVEQLALEVLIGPASIVEVLTAEAITVEQLSAELPEVCERVLLKTSMQKNCLPRPTAWLEPAAADFLRARRVRLVGIDSSSIDNINAAHADSHRVLLAHNVVVVENLVLAPFAAGEYEMICLPLNLIGLEGAPARVVLRKRSEVGS